MAAIFLFSALPPPSYIFFLLCLKSFIFLLSDVECYLLFRYIWFTYVFSTDKGVIFMFSNWRNRICIQKLVWQPSFFLFSLSYIPVDEKYCIFPPVGGIASFFFSCNREFHLVFKYVYVYICFLRRKLINSRFSPWT